MADDATTDKLSILQEAAAKCTVSLKTEDRNIRKKVLIEFRKSFHDCQAFLSQHDCNEIVDKSYQPLLTAFNDPVEKCREISCEILNDLIRNITVSKEALALIIETLLICLTSPDEREPSEEVRLVEIQILCSLINMFGNELMKHLNDIVQILVKCIVDSYPEVKRLSCKCTTDLSYKLRMHFHMVSGSFINPLLKTITHQHFKTRVLCVTAIGSVIQHGNNENVSDVVSHLAQRLFDHSSPVRLAVVEVIGTWLVELLDRYSFFPRLIPLLLSALYDEIPNIREKAEQLWNKAGQVYLEENEKDYKDKVEFPKPMPLDYPASRPPLGCRFLIQKYFCNILPALLNDIDNWIPETRVKSSQLLYILLLHCEEKATIKLQQFIQGIILSAKDNEKQSAEMAIQTAELLGYFIEPKLWSDNLLPLISAKPDSHLLGILAALIRGYGKKPIGKTCAVICNTLSDNFVCRNRKAENQANLLLCVEALLTLQNYIEEIYQLFVILASVAGLTANRLILEKAKELLMSLWSAKSVECALQFGNYFVMTFLKKLIETNELWTSQSPEVSIFIYLVSEGCIIEKVAILAIPIIVNQLQVQKDPKLRSEFLSLVIILLKKLPLDKNGELKSNIYQLLNDGIFPNLEWSAGRTAAALRAIAVASMWEIIKVKRLDSSMLASISGKLLPILNSLADDDLTTNRLLACKILEQILPSLVPSIDELLIHKTCYEFLRCLDDEFDDVRISAIRVFLTYFNSFSPKYNWMPWKAYLQHIYKNIIIHMDDKNEEVQMAAFELLKEASYALPEILLHEIESVRYAMAASDLCTKLIHHVKDRQKNIL